MLMTILTQAFFTLVRRHLVSLMLLSVWHNELLIKMLYYYFDYFLLAYFHFANVRCQFCGCLEDSYRVLRNLDRGTR